jgi:hypothetical protein
VDDSSRSVNPTSTPTPGWDFSRSVAECRRRYRSRRGAYALEALPRHDRGYTGYAPITGTPWLTASSERCVATSIPTGRSPSTGLTRWARSNYVPASNPKREYASLPATSPPPPFAIGRRCCAASWLPAEAA